MTLSKLLIIQSWASIPGPDWTALKELPGQGLQCFAVTFVPVDDIQ